MFNLDLIKKYDRFERQRVVENLNCPPEILAELAEDEHQKIRSSVALHPRTPRETLEKLARDEYDTVRRNVADNSKTPIILLKVLENDKDETVREYAQRAVDERTRDFMNK